MTDSKIQGSEPAFIQESTLIPESHFGDALPSESVTAIPESASESFPGESRLSEPRSHSSSALKKNLPFVVLGVVAVVLVGTVAVKSGLTSRSHDQQRVATASTAVQDAKPRAPDPTAVTPRAAVESPPVSIENASAPGSVAARADTSAATPSTALVAAVPAAQTAPAQINVAPQPANNATSDAEIGRINDHLRTHDKEISELQARVSQREAGLKGNTVAAEAPANPAAVKKEKVVKPTPKQLASAAAARDRRAKEKSDSAAKTAAIRQAVASYQVHVVRDNLVWVRSTDGQIRSFAVGDVVPGVGKLTAIDEHNHTVTAGGNVLK